MGHPKRHRKKYSLPRKPYDKERIIREASVMSKYGLRRKKEIWKAEAIVRDFRHRAREILANPNQKTQDEMMQKLHKMGILVNNIEDVLSLKLDDLLSRRLQTNIHQKGIAKTLMQARQMIVHGHIKIDGRKVGWPSYVVPAGYEDKISVSEAQRVKVLNEVNKE